MSAPARRLVLITGASAGIGDAFARAYARRGWDVILTARRRDRLEALARALASEGVQAHVVPADLGADDGTDRLLAALRSQGLSPDGLVNNAGYSRTSGFLASAWADHEAMIRVMLTAPVRLAHGLAPAMVERGFGRIINVASLAGTMPATGGDTLYGPIKSFLIKASQGLHLELKDRGVHVTALCPGYTWSEFHDVNGSRAEVAAAYPRWMWMTAEAVVEAGIEGVEANRPRVVPGLANRLLSGLAQHLPNGMALKMVGGHARRLKRL